MSNSNYQYIFRLKEEKYWILLSKKISGEASPEELDQLNKLIESNPEWLVTLENLQELWESKPVPANIISLKNQKAEDAYLSHVIRLKEKSVDFESDIQDYGEELNPFPGKKKPYRKIATYLMAASLLVGGLFIYRQSQMAAGQQELQASLKETGPNEINVAKGSKSRIQLPDGSLVWINSGSTVIYSKSFSSEARELTLEGEAYFDVVKDPRHPFIVHTSGIDIKVLGTAFNVKAYKSEPTIEATLIHGSIEVIKKDEPNGSRIMLKPHEKLVFHKLIEEDRRDQRANLPTPAQTEPESSSIVIAPLAKNIADSNIVETGWVYNKLIFEDERFEDLANRMEEWYNIKITIDNNKLRETRLTGTFVNETIEEALKELQFLVRLRYSFKNNEVVISGGK